MYGRCDRPRCATPPPSASTKQHAGCFWFDCACTDCDEGDTNTILCTHLSSRCLGRFRPPHADLTLPRTPSLSPAPMLPPLVTTQIIMDPERYHMYTGTRSTRLDECNSGVFLIVAREDVGDEKGHIRSFDLRALCEHMNVKRLKFDGQIEYTVCALSVGLPLLICCSYVSLSVCCGL